MTNHIIMKDLPESERPYEKLLHHGPSVLSDGELLAIILKTGTKEHTAYDIAKLILNRKHKNLLNIYDCSISELLQIPGIGQIKAIQLKAIGELSKRISQTLKGFDLHLQDPKSIAEYYMESLRHLNQEVLVVAFFDAKFHFLGDEMLSMGSIRESLVPVREIFLKALEYQAVDLVVLHNHPSGNPYPSKEDILVTNRLKTAASILGMELMDHIIIGDTIYYSFKEEEQI